MNKANSCRWHQDIKPANILVAGKIDSNRYDVLFMLADLGVTHFTTVVEEKSSLTGEDYVGGTRAYSTLRAVLPSYG